MKLLKTVGLADFARRFPWQLSGGMQQRSNLCRALIHEPELLMLDEPFGALDAFTREELWGIMRALWLEQRFTGILVTHDLRESVPAARIPARRASAPRFRQDPTDKDRSRRRTPACRRRTRDSRKSPRVAPSRRACEILVQAVREHLRTRPRARCLGVDHGQPARFA